MIVVDASVLASALLDDAAGAHARRRLSHDPRWAAPSHLRIEVASVARGRALARKITEGRAEQGLRALAALAITCVDYRQLWPMIWKLRTTMAAYAAAYVAVARLYDCALVTADLRLAEAAVSSCSVTLVRPEENQDRHAAASAG